MMCIVSTRYLLSVFFLLVRTPCPSNFQMRTGQLESVDSASHAAWVIPAVRHCKDRRRYQSGRGESPTLLKTNMLSSFNSMFGASGVLFSCLGWYY